MTEAPPAPTPTPTGAAPNHDEAPDHDEATLASVERRVLWLSAAIVDHANRVRENPSGVKVGGHQASSASIATIMTALWFTELHADDRVSVKPHASPVLHAINYLLGRLDASYLPRLRDMGGLQSYPSRTKDPDPVDYSTGSVGIGATAPIWGAVARRFVERFGDEEPPQRRGRQWSLLGDAELDEGACWEAVLDSQVADLGEVVWVVDVNRQSLDRVVPLLAVERLERMFAAAGWQVLTVKYGRRLQTLFDRPGGDALRERIDAMPNAEYQRLLRCDADELRDRLPGDGERADDVRGVIAPESDEDLLAAIGNLGGHDLGSLCETFATIDDDRPTVVLAYTVKGNGLATRGHPQNHSALLTEEQMRELAQACGTDLDDPWQGFADGTAEAALCASVAERLDRDEIRGAAAPDVPSDIGRLPSGTTSTQAALGRALLDLNHDAPEVAERVVTVSPDVSSSTNLGGWVNKVGVWSVDERRDWFADDSETVLHWRERPQGQHVELGIAEGNLVGLLGELGATWSRWDQPLLPIGVLYDPFVGRALEPWSFGMYAGGHSILVGTPSGVTLAGEGGAHQSITTPSIGLEQPGCVAFEPAFAADLRWCLLDGLGRLGREGATSTYLRLSTRPVDQSLAAVPEDPAARERRRRQVVAGGYPLRRADRDPDVTIATMGAVVTEALAAADRLEADGVAVDVLCVTSPGRLFESVRAREGRADGPSWILDQLLPADRACPVVTHLDGHPHTLAFLGGVHPTASTTLGVSEFGQVGSVEALYRHHRIDADAVVEAALDLTHR